MMERGSCGAMKREKGGIDGGDGSRGGGEGDGKGAVRREEAGKQPRFSESRTTEMGVYPLCLCSSQALWLFNPSL